MSDDTARYALAARLIHWIMAAGFVFMWGCGYAMTTLVEEDSPLEEFLFDLPISVGVTLLILLVLRIAVRLVHRAPPLPDTIRGLERRAALQDLSAEVHMWLAYTMLAVAAGHVAAAFKHRWSDGHDALHRMTFGRRR